MRWFLSRCAIWCVLCLSSPVGAAELRIASGEYPPFTESATPGGGMVNSVAQRVAQSAGFDPQFEYMPWARGLELTRAGRYAVASFWYWREDREADFIHVGPVVENRLVFFHLADQPIPAWETLTDLSDYTIGGVTGYTFTPEFWQLAEQGVLDVELAPSDEANIRKLLAGRIALYPMSEESGWHLIDTLFGSEARARFAILEQPLVTTEGYLLVSRKIEDAERIAQALQSAVDALSLSFTTAHSSADGT